MRVLQELQRHWMYGTLPRGQHYADRDCVAIILLLSADGGVCCTCTYRVARNVLTRFAAQSQLVTFTDHEFAMKSAVDDVLFHLLLQDSPSAHSQ